jgi:hypothetical protein
MHCNCSYAFKNFYLVCLCCFDLQDTLDGAMEKGELCSELLEMSWRIAIILDLLSDALKEANDGDNIANCVAKAHATAYAEIRRTAIRTTFVKLVMYELRVSALKGWSTGA